MMAERKTPSRVFRVEITDEEHKAEAARSAIFAGWLDECSEFQDKMIEATLANLPSLSEG